MSQTEDACQCSPRPLCLASLSELPHPAYRIFYDSFKFYGGTQVNSKVRACLQSRVGGITYMATSGMWQSVWLESVPNSYVTNVEAIPNIDTNSMTVTVRGSNGTEGRLVSVTAKLPSDGSEAGSGIGLVNGPINIPIPNPALWTPERPNLYSLSVHLLAGNVTIENAPQFTEQGLYAPPVYDMADVEDEVSKQICTQAVLASG